MTTTGRKKSTSLFWVIAEGNGKHDAADIDAVPFSHY